METKSADRVGVLADAIAFAADAHRGQVYRSYGDHADEPYILHPLRVMAAVSDRAKVVAVLHDCMEDAGRLPDWLHEGERAALAALTRDKKSDTYSEYIWVLSAVQGTWAEIAREVKVADLRDNLAHDPPPRLRERYEAALARLAPDA